jgi:hypothetical protein
MTFTIMASAVGITFATVILHGLVRRLQPMDRLRSHHDVAAAVYAMLGVLHGLIFGYLVVTGQERLDDANAAITREVALLQDLQHVSHAMAPDDGAQLRSATIAYARHVVEIGWPAMAADAIHEVRPRPLRALWTVIMAADDGGGTRTAVKTAALNILDELSEARERRMHLSDERLGSLMLIVLYLGAASLVGGLFLFAHASTWIQLTSTALVTLTVTLIVALVLALDAPVASGLLTPEAFEDLLRHSSSTP